MKRIMLGMALFGVIFSTSLWAHHAAEGIVSDEIWQMIDQNLIDAESPHLINFDNITLDTGNTMDTATVYTDPVTGDMYLLTVAEVYFDETLSESDYDDYIEAFIEVVLLPTLDDSNGIPSGRLNDDTSAVFYEVEYIDFPADGIIDYAEISIYEPIGNGNSQVGAAASVSATAPGQRKSGG